MTKLSLFGTIHSSNESKTKIKKILEQHKFDALLTEGVQTKSSGWYRKEPFLIIPARLYFGWLDNLGSEFTIVDKIAKDNNIDNVNMDKSLDELVNYFHKPYYNVIFLIVIIAMIATSSNLFLIIVSFIVAEIVYSAIFAYKFINLRDNFFHEKINDVDNSEKYTNVLIICGNEHVKGIMKIFPNVEDLTNTF
ncbi:MAG: hypothetical protein OI717_00410 (plasmid) [Candidatus Methanoperedens sp.]|nr:MAG: hypothetical protein OI717_00410 [Candidatus Methanoperedens sp.]